jgi:phosphinothricin acetyltransferase
MATIRTATEADLPAIFEIYNDYILTSTATFDIEPKTPKEQRDWLSDHDTRFEVLVSEDGGVVTGWASLTRWAERGAYIDTAEVSLYIHKEHRKRGIGKELLDAMIEIARKNRFHTLIAQIVGGNEKSHALFEKAGFEHIGVMREIGQKFDTYLDVIMMQLFLNKTPDGNMT